MCRLKCEAFFFFHWNHIMKVNVSSVNIAVWLPLLCLCSLFRAVFFLFSSSLTAIHCKCRFGATLFNCSLTNIQFWSLIWIVDIAHTVHGVLYAFRNLRNTNFQFGWALCRVLHGNYRWLPILVGTNERHFKQKARKEHWHQAWLDLKQRLVILAAFSCDCVVVRFDCDSFDGRNHHKSESIVFFFSSFGWLSHFESSHISVSCK